MSENLSTSQIVKFEHVLQTGSHSPHLSKKFAEDPQLCLTLYITSLFVKEVEKAKVKFPDFSYVDIINSQIHAYKLINCERLEKRFFALCKKVDLDFRTKYRSGYKRDKYNSHVFKVAVFQTELFEVKELDFHLQHFKKENLELENRCEELLNLLQSERANVNDMKKQTDAYENKLQCLSEKNENLLNYVKLLESKTVTCKTQKNFDSLSTSMKHRTIRELKKKSEKALWFAESYGLLPLSIKFQSESGKMVNVDMAGSKGSTQYKNLDSSYKQKLKDIIFIMDKFGLSDAAYHELTYHCHDLPKKYLICQSRSDLNDIFHIERAPGNVPGAYISLKNDLEMLLNKQQKDTPDKIKLKISGDGTKVSRISNFLVISYSVMDELSSVSVDKQRVLGILSCCENYEMINKTCNPIFQEINDMYSRGSIILNDKTVEIETIFGGDMKFIQLVLGLGGSTGNYACPWCRVHKDERQNLDRDWDYFHSQEMSRTLANLRQESTKKRFGSKFPPLLNIEPCNIIPDELHLLLRIGDVLLRNLIDDAKRSDDLNKVNNRGSGNLDELVQKIRGCGVSFNIWHQKGSNGELDWTSLTGSDYKILFSKLPEKLCFIINHDTHDKTVKLWTDFYSIYRYICHEVHTFSNIQSLFEKCRAWAKLFLSLGELRKGYSTLTPYMHVFVFHIPWFVKTYGSLSKFSGQGVEKVNDKIKMIHQKKTNKIDSAVDALKVRKRIETLQDENCDREKRAYEKRNQVYWEDEIFKNRSEKRSNILKEISDMNISKVVPECDPLRTSEIDYSSMTEIELKELLMRKNVKTRVRKKEKLIDLLKSLD